MTLFAVPSPAETQVRKPEEIVGFPDLSKSGHVTLYLRNKTVSQAQEQKLESLFTGPPRTRTYLTHEQVEELTGSYAADVQAVQALLTTYGLQITSQNPLTGQLTVTGDLQGVQNAFNAHLAVVNAGGTMRLASTKGFQLPVKLQDVVQRIQPFGPPDRKESRLPIRPIDDSRKLMLATAPPAGYTPAELARASDFPPGATGAGQVIGLIELGGQMNQADFAAFCQGQQLTPPRVVEVGTPPAITDPSGAFMANMEVTLDLEILAALAPQATLVVYYGATIAEAMQAVVSDRVNRPSVVSISWAGSEFNYSPQEVAQMNQLFYQASLLGITVVAASADHGALNQRSYPNVSLPSSNPLVLGCGGTIVTLAPDGTMQSEVVWNEEQGQIGSGGGYSSLYGQPAYQQPAVARYPYQKYPTRGVPDIAANASMTNGYRVVFNGATAPIGGTSASTPFVAGLIALLNEQLGYRLGFVNAHLYAMAGTGAFRQITEGNNDVYAAAPYWNPCTGLGSPIGTQLLTLFRQL